LAAAQRDAFVRAGQLGRAGHRRGGAAAGKRLQNVLLLSGGEKAMTALALLIAIFRYQPSPFCILDEVDAPLDEANVGRFTKLVSEMSASTQFIVVTTTGRPWRWLQCFTESRCRNRVCQNSCPSDGMSPRQRKRQPTLHNGSRNKRNTLILSADFAQNPSSFFLTTRRYFSNLIKLRG